MSLTIEQFWNLAIKSQLVTPEEVGKYSMEYAKAAGAAAPTVDSLATWLIAERRLSQYQCKILRAGKPGPFVYGNYCIYDRIESGRLAGIFRALHVSSRHPVCLYFLSGPSCKDSEIMASLTQQAVAANRASMGHPHLHRCYHLSDQKAYKFVVVEDLQGKRLERKLATTGRLPPAEACRIARQAALGLARLHAMGQVHGEIRPANIWLKPNGLVKLLLFPLYRDPFEPDFREIITATDKQQRMPPWADYLAPELIAGDRLPDAQSDVYSLGCTLYHMLANQAPFTGGDFRQKLARHQSEKPVPLDRIDSAIPTPLAKLVNYMMAKDPEMRYQQANSVVEALLPHLAPGEAETQPAPPSRRSVVYEKWLQQRSATTPPAPGTATSPATGTASAPMPTVPAPQPAPAVAARNTPATPLAATPVAAAPLAAAAVAAVPIAAVPIAAVPMPATPLMATPVGAQPLPAMPIPARGVVGGPAVAMAVPVGASPVAAPVAGAALRATPVGAAATMAAPAYAHALDVGAVASENAASARSRRRAQNARRTAVIGVVAFLLICGVAGGGLWYAKENGMLDALLADLNGKENIDPPIPPTPPPPPIINPVVEPEKEDPTKAKGYVWGLEDGMWEAPTHGDPLDLKYAPVQGLKAVVAIRPADIAKHPEGERLFDPKVSGPLGTWVQQQLPATSGTTIDNIELALIGVLDNPAGLPRLSLVLHFFQPVDAAAVKKAWPDAEEEKQGERSFFHKGDDAYFLPASAGGKILVVAPLTEMRDIVSSDGSVPLLPLQLESMLRTSTDQDRMLTIVASGDMLSTAGQGLLLGPAAALEHVFDWLLASGDSADPAAEAVPPEMPKAVLFSCHLGEEFFAELRFWNSEAAPDSTLPAESIRQRLEHDVRRKLSKMILELHPSNYSTNVLAEFPDQAEVLEKNTLVGVVDKQVVLRAYLPAAAASSLTLGTYLCLLEAYSGPAGGPPPDIAKTTGGAATAAEALKRKMTLSFQKNALDMTIQQIADEIGVPILIQGSDLQIEGITKNQSLNDFKEIDKPVIDILLKILKQANTDGKLIYIIKNVDGKEVIWLTTRVAAEKRGDKLPPEMVQAAPDKKKK